MAATKYDFSIEQGSSFNISFVYKNENQQIVNISNWCARLVFRTNDNQVYTFTTENTDTSLYQLIIDGLNGKITLSIPSVVTNTYNFFTAKYDIELQSDQEIYIGGGKNTIRLHYGIITIKKRFSGLNTTLEC